jgi:cell division protein FtsI (penicillin-binding protein 3)
MIAWLRQLLKRDEGRAAAAARARRPGAASTVRYASSPLLASKTPSWRSRALVVLMGTGFAVLLGRAAFVQLINPDFFQKKGEERYAATLPLTASRGRILDRNGQILAASVAAPTVAVDPRHFKADATQRRALAELLGLRLREMEQRIAKANAYVVLRRQVEDVTARRIAALGIKGLQFEPGYRRHYPEGEAAAHVVGFTDTADRGQEGVELSMQSQLQGHAGSRNVVKNRIGEIVEEFGEPVAPREGRDVTLTIDSRLQALAYQRVRDAVREHRAKGGSAVVLDAQSGEILALANYPSFDPSDRSRMKRDRLVNIAANTVLEPGSTVKPFIAAYAIEHGFVRPDTWLDTKPLRVGRLTVRDIHPHPSLTVAQVIQKSSNPGTVRLSMRIEPQAMWEMYTGLGLGQKPRIGIPGAATGRLRPWARWKPVEKATMAYGYGLNASLLQLARAYTALARDGETAPLTLVRGEEAQPGVRVFKPETARTMRRLLKGTVSREGTAPLAQPEGYSAGGKTGTAEKLDADGRYEDGKNRAFFVGLSPIEQPRIVVGVVVDEPGGDAQFGGLVAAPVFRAVVEQTLRTLGVPPDVELGDSVAHAGAADSYVATGRP